MKCDLCSSGVPSVSCETTMCGTFAAFFYVYDLIVSSTQCHYKKYLEWAKVGNSVIMHKEFREYCNRNDLSLTLPLACLTSLLNGTVGNIIWFCHSICRIFKSLDFS